MHLRFLSHLFAEFRLSGSANRCRYTCFLSKFQLLRLSSYFPSADGKCVDDISRGRWIVFPREGEERGSPIHRAQGTGAVPSSSMKIWKELDAPSLAHTLLGPISSKRIPDGVPPWV